MHFISIFMTAMVLFRSMAQTIFKFHETSDFEYVSYLDKAQWDDAERICKRWYGHLPSVHNNIEMNLIKKMTAEFPRTASGHKYVWLGGSHPEGASEKDTEWSDGTPFDFIWRGSIRYPSPSDGCLFYSAVHRYWGDGSCDSVAEGNLQNYFAGIICKRPKQCCTAYDKPKMYSDLCEGLFKQSTCRQANGPCNWGDCPRNGCCEHVQGQDVWKRKCPRNRNEFACGYDDRSNYCQWNPQC